MQSMTSQACRMKADEETANAAATSLPKVRERAIRAAAAWTEMADRAEINEVERSRRESSKVAAPVGLA